MWDSFWELCAEEEYDKMLARAPEHAQSMDKAHSEPRVCFMQTCPGDQSTLHTCIVWKSSRENGVKLKVLREGEWMGSDADVGEIFPVPVHYFHIRIDITFHRK